MQSTVRGKSLEFTHGKKIDFEFPIRSAIEAGNITIVLLDVPKDAVMTENVFGVTPQEGIIWQIERIPETSRSTANAYMDARLLSENVVQVGNWNGFEIDVNVRDGRVIGKKWLK